MFVPAGTLANKFRGLLTDRLSVAQYHNFLKGLQLHDCYLENENFQRWKGTVLDCCPNQLTEHEDYLGLIDAGFFINTSCPPLLRKERKALEQASNYYTNHGIPFPKVVLLEEDKKQMKECYFFDQSRAPGCPILLFFPLVNDTFRYYKAPGVKRCHDEMAAGNVDVSSCRTPYSTFCLTYSEENFDKLLNLSEYNVLNNQHLILQALHTAVARKRQQCWK
ncbi:Cytosolic phospholipase A2 epsilon [Varanus komodoensis]|nr:Cytosolic phospholipase A2 epsilon [Varanus komodoensis]